VETVPLMLDPSTLVPTKNIRPLENASISPWTYNVSTDSSLLTPVVSEAHCLLKGCLDSEGKEDLNLRSRPIMHQVLQLRRVKAATSGGQSYHYRLETRLMAVGCTCVRPMVQIQQ
ncbi:interleukin-17F-like, partial [Odontesthes bonariensis]